MFKEENGKEGRKRSNLNDMSQISLPVPLNPFCFYVIYWISYTKKYWKI